ncbi:hypothetical protein YC2023_012382 [Brassica napus]
MDIYALDLYLLSANLKDLSKASKRWLKRWKHKEVWEEMYGMTVFMTVLERSIPKVFQERRTSPALKIEKYILFSGTQESFCHIRKASSSPVYLKISRNVLLSTGPYLSMRENSNMVLVPQYKNAKEQHKKCNMRRISDLNLARNEEKIGKGKTIPGCLERFT